MRRAPPSSSPATRQRASLLGGINGAAWLGMKLVAAPLEARSKRGDKWYRGSATKQAQGRIADGAFGLWAALMAGRLARHLFHAKVRMRRGVYFNGREMASSNQATLLAHHHQARRNYMAKQA